MAKKRITKSPFKGVNNPNQFNLRKSFMIFTEGETEEGYFKTFKVRCKTIKGGNALKLVEEAIVQKENVKSYHDQYWVVIDKDDSTELDFLKALDLAQKHQLRVAYSCEAFEIWWLFHYIHIQAPIQRKDYEKKIKQYLQEYSSREKGKVQGRHMRLLLNPLLSNGIENAKQAHKNFKNPNIAFHQSVTTVYELVELLIENSSFIDD
jgi:hypothetical protein